MKVDMTQNNIKILDTQRFIMDSNKIPINRNLKKSDEKFSIGIVTFNKRFENYLKPLITKIRQGYDGDIFISVNGNHKEDFDQTYRKELLEFVKQYDNIYVYIHPVFRSLARLWNECILNSTSQYMILLNDDNEIPNSEKFFDDMRIAMTQTNHKIFKVTNWCCTFINKKEVMDIGWFDENFLGVGCEDFDFEIRYFGKYKEHIPNILNIDGYKNIIEQNDTVSNQRRLLKYSKFNYEYMISKYDVVDDKIIQKISDIQQYKSENFYLEHNNEL